MQKIVDNEELMEWMRGDPDVYVSSSEDFKFAWRKRWMNEITSATRIDIVSQKQSILQELALRKKQEVYETGKKRKAFCITLFRHYTIVMGIHFLYKLLKICPAWFFPWKQDKKLSRPIFDPVPFLI